MLRYNTYITMALFIILATPVSAATTTTTSTLLLPYQSSSTATSSPFVSFCDNIEIFTTNIRTNATTKASEHRIELERLSSEREGEKKKLSEVRAEVRLKEDISRETIIDLFKSRASTQITKDAIDHFSTTTGKLLRDLRASSDKAREDYAKVIRNVSLAERTKRNRALDSYIDKLDAANDFAEEQCAKGAKDANVLSSYNIWLKSAKDDLSKNLKLKKSTLEQRAKDVHERELIRLEAEYQRKVQKEIQILIEKFPELIVIPEPTSATDTKPVI
jgi:hypothetical protein